MKKILAGILVCIFITTAVMPTMAYAYQAPKSYDGSGYCMVVDRWVGGAEYDVRIHINSERGQNLKGFFQYLRLQLMVDRANAEIEELVRYAQATPKDDVEWLLKKVDKIVSRVMDYADRIDAEVACEYTEYYIDGQYVLIDPLMVVNVRGRGTR